MSNFKTASRRDFLKASAAGAGGLVLAGVGSARPQARPGTATSCILINLVGGPSHIDTFDPKPDAPSEIRGPFRPIQTKVPGLHVSELFPRLATMTDKFALIRSMHHTAPPIHECGFQLLNTGRLFRDGPEWPSVGAVVAYLAGQNGSDRGAYAVVPSLEINTGVNISHGQGDGTLDVSRTVMKEDWAIGMDGKRRPANFADQCRCAMNAIRPIARPFAIVNMFSTVFDSVSWDCHADGGSLKTDLNDIRETVAPSFDTAFARLLEELEGAGRLESTLVVATGEFGRTPRMNANGGRDHWAGAWTSLIAGGGIQGGQVLGRTDAKGTEPTDRPVTPQELVATIFHALGVPADARIPGPHGSPVDVYPGKPLVELF